MSRPVMKMWQEEPVMMVVACWWAWATPREMV
jgi:hypothetical protein